MQILMALDTTHETTQSNVLPALGDADDFAQLFHHALPSAEAGQVADKNTQPATDATDTAAQTLPDLPVVSSKIALPVAAIVLAAPTVAAGPVATSALQQEPDKKAVPTTGNASDSETQAPQDVAEDIPQQDVNDLSMQQKETPPIVQSGVPAAMPAPDPARVDPVMAEASQPSPAATATTPADKTPATQSTDTAAPPAPAAAAADAVTPATNTAPLIAAPITGAAETSEVTIPERLALDRPGWSDKMLEIAQAMATRATMQGQAQVLTLTLTPETLGPMQIRLEVIDGQTHVHIVTETAETARIMADAQPRLHDLMARAGLEMATSTTTSEGRSGQDRPQQIPQAGVSDEAETSEPMPQTAPRATLSQFDLIA